MSNIIAIAIVFVVVGLAAAYVIRQKKSGVKCIGCPNGAKCSAENCCSCMEQI